MLDTESTYWLADDRALHYILFSDQTWINTEMVPLLDTSRLMKFARVTTAENLLLQDVARVLGWGRRMTVHGFETRMEVFTEKEAALEWILPWET